MLVYSWDKWKINFSVFLFLNNSQRGAGTEITFHWANLALAPGYSRECVEWDFSWFKPWTCLPRLTLPPSPGQEFSTLLSRSNRRPSARLESPVSDHLLLLLTKRGAAARGWVGWEGVSVWVFVFFFPLSSADVKTYQCSGSGMNWDHIRAPPLPSSWPWSNHLAFRSLSCFIC